MDDVETAQFREYVAARQGALLRSALLLTGHRQDAEDLVQGALIKLALKWSTIGRDGALDAYVRTTMYHQWVSRWRRHRHGREYALDAVPERPTAGDLAGDSVLRIALAEVLGQLAPKQRAVIVLRYFEDLPESEGPDTRLRHRHGAQPDPSHTCSPPRAVRRAGTDEGAGMITDLRIREALDDLAGAPQAEGLADRALRGATRRRVARIGGAGAAAAVTTLAALAAVHIARAPAPQPATDPAACVQYPPASPGVILPRDQWPDFAEAAIAALPPGPEYGVYAASGWCDPDGPTSRAAPNAWAIITVGDFEGQYNLQIYLGLGAPSGCGAELPSAFLFCREATANTPQVYAAGNAPMVSATYADGTTIVFRPYGQTIPGTPMADVEQLADVAADPGLYMTIPGD
jgi:RNA polymerase sigma factor (sigma-70 family)